MRTSPAVPEHILLQSILIDAHGDEAGYRIYDDGRYEIRPTGESWSPATPLTNEQLTAVRAAISEAEFDHLEPQYPAPERADDQATLWVQAVRNGQLHSVAIEHPRTVPAIEQLSAALVAIFKDASA